MPTYKYQAALASGVSVFGIFGADDLSSLQAYLQSRSMTLVGATELSINSALSSGQQEMPRFMQMRIGDRLREALLTGMPAHDAVRAIAEEPLEHPVLMVMPWAFFLSLFLAAVSLLGALLVPESRGALLGAAVVAPLVAALVWWSAHIWFVVRPQKMLLKMARQLESGATTELSGLGFLPGELQAVMSSRLTSQAKSVSMAELVPTIAGMQFQSHLFAMRIMGPLLAMALLLIGLHVLMLTIVPQFTEIFIGFGVELPGLTLLICNIGKAASVMGIPGLLCSIAVAAGILASIYALLVLPRTAEIWEGIPVLGLSVRWLMQARVARILGVLIRNDAPPAEAIEVAAKASGFQSVAADGDRISERIRSGVLEIPYSRQLSGLPLSLLFRVGAGKAAEPERQQTAQAFQHYASALEQASAGSGSFFAILVEMFIVMSAGLLVGLVVISLFMPLIRLLNDLSVVTWWLL